MTSRDLIIEDIALNLDKSGRYIEGKVQIFITFARHHASMANLGKFRKNACPLTTHISHFQYFNAIKKTFTFLINKLTLQ